MLMLRQFAFALALLTPIGPALACSCVPPPPPREALTRVDAVFLGEVARIEEGAAQERGLLYVTLTVSRVWKGAPGKTVVVTTAKDGASCGYKFSNSTHLIYARGEMRNLRTGLCDRTMPLDEARADIKALGEGWEPIEKTSEKHLQARVGPVALGAPALVRFMYDGQIAGWDAAIYANVGPRHAVLANGAFIRVIGPDGRPRQSRIPNKQHPDHSLQSGFSDTVDLATYYDLSKPGRYTMHWGCKDVATAAFTLEVINLDAKAP